MQHTAQLKLTAGTAAEPLAWVWSRSPPPQSPPAVAGECAPACRQKAAHSVTQPTSMAAWAHLDLQEVMHPCARWVQGGTHLCQASSHVPTCPCQVVRPCSPWTSLPVSRESSRGPSGVQLLKLLRPSWSPHGSPHSPPCAALLASCCGLAPPGDPASTDLAHGGCCCCNKPGRPGAPDWVPCSAAASWAGS